jgi:threonine-phosphate decarboxylase
MAVTHGGEIFSTARKLNCDIHELVDMSSNLTPLGMVPGLADACMSRFDEISFLPETSSDSLVKIFAEKYGLKQENILVGNGTTDFIFTVPDALNSKRVVIISPTYADYKEATQLADIEIVDFATIIENNFSLDQTLLARQIKKHDLVFICNPNNPTGQMVKSEHIYNLAREYSDTTFLVDESYLSFIPEKSLLQFPVLDNLIVLTSFSKIFGIPGLRLGFFTGSTVFLKKIRTLLKPWGVNRIAQIAGEFLLNNGDCYVNNVQGFVKENRKKFVDSLDDIDGIKTIPGVVNFILCKLTGNISAAELKDKMLRSKFMIRNCDNFTGLDNSFFRLSLKDEGTNKRCVQVLKQILTDN